MKTKQNRSKIRGNVKKKMLGRKFFNYLEITVVKSKCDIHIFLEPFVDISNFSERSCYTENNAVNGICTPVISSAYKFTNTESTHFSFCKHLETQSVLLHLGNERCHNDSQTQTKLGNLHQPFSLLLGINIDALQLPRQNRILALRQEILRVFSSICDVTNNRGRCRLKRCDVMLSFFKKTRL